MQVPLANQVDISGFHMEAKRLLGQQVPPQEVEWSAPAALNVAEESIDDDRAAIRNRAARAIVPQSFMRMTELVVLHRDPDRFDLLYRSLWRLVYEPDLKGDLADADFARLRQMAQAVRREIHKMKSKLAFRTLTIKGESVPVACYEPAHYVAEAVGTWLARNEPARRWIILTPDRSLRWDGERLHSAPSVAPGAAMHEPRSDAELARMLEALPWT